jgi:hypothetical protein
LSWLKITVRIAIVLKPQHFNFAARIIRPGRSFVSHLISLSTKVNKLHHFITLSKEYQEDLRMWSTFLKG